jgi:para-nitrobenzyl esterase
MTAVAYEFGLFVVRSFIKHKGRNLMAYSVGWMTGLGLAVVMLIAGGDAAMGAVSTEVIETTSGPVQGSSDGHVDTFLGVRYAASPAGGDRWLPPVPPEPSQTIIDATKPGNACLQQMNQFSVRSPQSEDCLFLNVWRPHDVDHGQGLPVMIWIHGGGLVTGEGAEFDPSVMVESGNIIVVTINYRLGALGWLANSAIADADGNSGNYGLMDQQLAMKWVLDNIRNFGGNPKHVTISGESAGGLSTLSNLASPTAHDLFRGAIVESGAYMIFNIPSLAAQEARGVAFATAVGCTGTSAKIAACLRAAPAAALIAAQGIIDTSPTKGVPTLPQGLSDAFSSGEFNQVPVMQGTNLNEGTLFEPFAFDPTYTFVPGGPLNALIAAHSLTYTQAVAGLLGPEDAAAVAALYPPANFLNPDAGDAASADEAWGQIYTDLVFTCHGLTADELLVKFVPVYAYEFADPNAPNLFQPLIGFSYGASHGSELQYILSPAPGAPVQPQPLTAGGTLLAEEMKAYWTNFVKHGTPNGSDVRFVNARDDELADWPRFDADGDVQLLVPGPAEPHPFEGFGAEHNCQQLEALGLLGG